MPVTFQCHCKSCIRRRNWLACEAPGGSQIENRPNPYSLLNQACQARFKVDGKFPNLKETGPNSEDTVPVRRS